MWMIAGASVVTASVLAVAWGYHPDPRVEFKSSQVSEVRDWIRNRTGIDIPFAPADPRVKMIAASVGHTGAVEVRYRAAGREALLTAGHRDVGRSHREIGEIEHATSVSWNAGRETYTLSVQRVGDMRMACLVCHTETTI
jgi:hypothetical protein